MTKEIEEQGKDEINIRIQNKNPKKDPITYEIRTMQDIANCITSENVHGFLKDFEMSLHSYLLMQSLLNQHIQQGLVAEGTKLAFPYLTWIDDWKPKRKRKK